MTTSQYLIPAAANSRSACLSKIHKFRSSTPTDDRVHQFDFEGRNVLVFIDRKLRFLRYCRYSSGDLLHSAEGGGKFFFQLHRCFALMGSGGVLARQVKYLHTDLPFLQKRNNSGVLHTAQDLAG